MTKKHYSTVLYNIYIQGLIEALSFHFFQVIPEKQGFHIITSQLAFISQTLFREFTSDHNPSSHAQFLSKLVTFLPIDTMYISNVTY